MQIIYGTGNPAKLAAMQRRLAGLDLDIIGLKDVEGEIPAVPETGKSPLENARQKALAYQKARVSFGQFIGRCENRKILL